MPSDLLRAAAFVFGLWLAFETFGGLADAVVAAMPSREASAAVSAPATPR
jgi:hypothetical protein